MEGFDIANLCASLSLSEKDGPITKLDPYLQRIGPHKLSLCLVGKVITNKVINREAFRTILPKIWKTSQEFLRVWVRVDVTKSLQRCVRLILDDSGTTTTMILCNKRLPEFCSNCGQHEHVIRDCTKVDLSNMIDPNIVEYGGWLRTSSPVRNRCLSPPYAA
ncbi:hypothetical protein ACOSQ4_014087 [Xanthoceras sorbifolium]